ncbi:MAG: glycosyltransferase [Rhodospirillales bacterium]
MMIRKRTIFILLPVFNEGKSCFNLLERIDGLRTRMDVAIVVFAVNDGSTDDTIIWLEKAVRQLESLDIRLLAHDGNRGLGAGLETLFAAVAPNLGDTDCIVTMDSDDTHAVTLIPEMIAGIDRGADMVIASRYRDGSHVSGLPAFRRFLSFGARIVLTLRWRLPGVRDYTCLFRACSGAAVRRLLDHGPLTLRSTGFTATAELLTRLAPYCRSIAEVPIELRYENKVNPSNLKTLRTIVTTLRFVLGR